MTAFISWSGGKDSAMALNRTVRENIDVSHCLNMITEDGKHTRSHGILSEILHDQVEAMGLSIIQQPTTWDTYEEKFKEAIGSFAKQGINTGIFGDIDIESHRQWVERVCQEMGVKPILPLWLGEREQLMREFIDTGFQAVITAVNSSNMGPEWLGRFIDYKFMEDLKKFKNIDLCGEKGEYHTLVLDGPLFNKKINILETQPTKIENHWFLNITKYKLEDRN
jgi:diphthine-ammonia ligase